MQIELLDIINFITAFQLAFFSIFLFFKNNNQLNFRLLALFFLVQSSCILNTYTWKFYSYFSVHIPHLFYIGDTLLFLWGPFLYFFVKSSTHSNFKLLPRHILHAIPFILHFSFMFIKYFRFNTIEKQNLLQIGVLNTFESNMVYIIFHLLIFIYVIASLLIIYKLNTKIRNYYSNIEKYNFNWLAFILLGFAFIGISDVTYFIWKFFDNPPSILLKIVYPFIFILANLIVFKALQQPILFPINGHIKYSKSKLTTTEKKQILKQITTAIENEELFKDPNLTIAELSKKVNISSRYISQVINENINQNFYDFINSYRIIEASKLLNNDSLNLTVLEILYEVGFNSKSSFNTAFKKIYKITPTEFKVRNIQPHYINS